MMVIFWICVGIAAVVIELITPTALVSIWFASGAVIALLLELLQIDLWIQITAFFAVSFVSMFVVRPIAARYLRGNVVATNADRFINEVGIVTKEIKEDAWGEVKVQGMLWSAIEKDGHAVSAGEKVKVIAIEGAKLIVRLIAD